VSTSLRSTPHPDRDNPCWLNIVLLLTPECTSVTCQQYGGSAYSFRVDSPQRIERREPRYSVNLPVSLTVAHKELHTHSENISLGGILLSSTFLIPEGSNVEVAVGVPAPARPGMLLSARGKVLRVQPKASGGFGVAIKLERSFKLDRRI